MARQLKIDPLELRLRNCVGPGDLLSNGDRWATVGARQLLQRLRERLSEQSMTLEADEGIGIAMGGWPGGVEPANATCRMDRDGGVTVSVGAVDISGTSTTMAMITSEALGIPLDKIKVVHDDTSSAPYSPMAGGSKTIYTVGDAVMKAAEHARRQLLTIAADKLEVSPDDLELVDGHVQVRGLPDRSVTIAEIAVATQSFGGKYEPVFGRGSGANTERAPGFALQLARVRVDRETGQVAVREVVALQDVGRALNPAEVEGQVMGGVVQGIGWALYEEIRHDDQGQLQTGTMADYAIPRSEHAPAISTVLVENPSPRGPYGARGVGEPPVIPGAAAIANAIQAAVGVRIVDLPITPEKVLRALGTVDGSRP
jgi:CO/xanthine dehydrogenase Mo-binding subunit